MKKIISLMFVVFFLTFVSAITIYSGESITILLDKEFSYYSVVGNSSAVDLIVEQNGNEVTITTGKYMQSDSFEIILFDINKEIIVEYRSSGGGGGTNTIYKDKNITQYIDKEIIVYKDKEIEVEVEKIINKIPKLVWIVFIILFVGICSLIIYNYMIERRYRKNE